MPRLEATGNSGVIDSRVVWVEGKPIKKKQLVMLGGALIGCALCMGPLADLLGQIQSPPHGSMELAHPGGSGIVNVVTSRNYDPGLIVERTEGPVHEHIPGEHIPDSGQCEFDDMKVPQVYAVDAKTCLEPSCPNQRQSSATDCATVCRRTYGCKFIMFEELRGPWGANELHPDTPWQCWLLKKRVIIDMSQGYHSIKKHVRQQCSMDVSLMAGR